MNKKLIYALVILSLSLSNIIYAQDHIDSTLLSIDRIYHDHEFNQEYERPIQWIMEGKAYVTIETDTSGADELIRWDSQNHQRSVFLPAKSLTIDSTFLSIESFSLSQDDSKVMIFTNSSRVWRANTKGDYWVYDFGKDTLKKLGKQFESSSLMFAKFSLNNKYVYYVQNFNLYQEEFLTGKVIQLTFDGDGKIINGTFDWAYEEEFGKRDGFELSPNSTKIAFWNIDASAAGTFYMINNTDSIYSKIIPIQYPKVGTDPSACKVGIINLANLKINWIPLEGSQIQNYTPGMQWINDDLLLIQQLNRKQNQLTVWTYKLSTGELERLYVEKEDTFIELLYPDESAGGWDSCNLLIVDDGKAFLRMTETDGWRHVYKINISTGEKILITPGEYDVASIAGKSDNDLYFIASPSNSTQRYLYKIDLTGNGNLIRLTPENFAGINTYNISPNGKFALHTHQSTKEPRTVRLLSLPDHKEITTLVENLVFKEKLSKLSLPDVRFLKVTTEEDIEIDVRIILPINFESDKKYPVLFFVYGEPWEQVALDKQIGMWNTFLAQKGYVIIHMDNRGTPCLKGSEWRKSIYKKVGVINTRDQALAAKEILKLDYLDNSRTAVWGWSGGGTMTLNLMFQYPEIYNTGIAVAAQTNMLFYDNIYEERYMGLPQENMDDYIAGSPITYAKNLQGNLLIIHGTADDNVHYQNAELLVNELIKQNKQFQIMAYPNRSHSIWEGENTRRHLYTLMYNYLLEHTPPN